MIKGLTDQKNGSRLARAGVIRLGFMGHTCLNKQCKKTVRKDVIKCPQCGGQKFTKNHPAESPGFILDDAPGVAEKLGAEAPTELNIFFPFDEVEENFPTSMKLYSAQSLICTGDGECITHAINPATGKAIIRNGIALEDISEAGQEFGMGEVMNCPGMSRDLYPKCEGCAPAGTLRVFLPEVPRLAYFQISTRSHNNISSLVEQLGYIRNILKSITGTGRLSGVPFILRRVPRSISAQTTDNQGNPTGKVRVTKYFLELEVEPEYMTEILRGQRQLAAPSPALLPPEVADQDTFDGDFEPVEDIPTYPTKEEFFGKVKGELGILNQVAGFILTQSQMVNGQGYEPEQTDAYWAILSTLGKDLQAFCEKLISEVMYYTEPKHVLETITALDLTYDPENEQSLYDELATLAEAKADEESAKQEQPPITEEEIPF